MPLYVPCPVVRRSSPEEDYMWTLSGVRSLIDQQQQLLKLFTSHSNPTNKSDQSDNKDDESKHNSIDKYKASSYLEVRANNSKDLTSSNTSSIQTIRRILEIEELRKFSDGLEAKFDIKFTKE